MDRLDIQLAFTDLKPLCDSLMKDANIIIIKNIRECIAKTSNTVLQDLLEYISFPIIVHLQNPELSTTIKEELVITIRAMLSKTRIKNILFFHKLYACLLIQIYDKTQSQKAIAFHEELKETVILCIQDLIHCSTTEVLELLYVRKNAQKLSQGVYFCILMARTEKSPSLRLAAIKTVMTLTQVDEKADTSDIVLQSQVADVIMLFLPGIAGGLLEVAIGCHVQGHQITMMSIRAWCKILTLVMQDLDNDNEVSNLNTLVLRDIKISHESSDPLALSSNLTDPNKMKMFLDTTTRNQEWLDAAALQLNTLIKKLDSLIIHSHWKVRKESAEGIGLLLTKCGRNMKPNTVILIEYLISLSEDDVEVVKVEARKMLNIISNDYSKIPSMRPLIQLVEESFYNLLTKLPRIIRRSDDAEQLSCLNQLAGYLRVLGEHKLSYVLTSISHVQRLLLAFVYIMELDYHEISLLEDIGERDFDNNYNFHQWQSWKQLKFIRNKSCQEKLITICKILQQFGDVKIMIHHILNLMHETPRHRKELTFFLNLITDAPNIDSSLVPVYKQIVDFYIADDLWYLPVRVEQNLSLNVAQSNVLQSCLLVEGLGLVAKNLKSQYELFLLKTLYLVIEKAGSPHCLISYVGIQALENIAKSQNHTTISDLLKANVDYFSYHVTVKLRRIDRNPGVLDVLGIVVKYSTMDVLPCLKRIVEDVLVQLNYNFQKQNAYLFLKVFYVFTICIKKLIVVLPEDTCESKIDDPTETIIQNLLEYYNAKKVDELIEDDNSINEDEDCDSNPPEPTEFEEEDKKQIPSHINIIEEVMKNCLHFLPSKDVEKSIMAMLALQEGLQILSQWENQLLPIVHQLWHPLVDRFHHSNFIIVNRAWQLLRVLSVVSKDFIRSRTLKQVLPTISKFLTTSAEQSYKKNSKHAYGFTQMYKLQKEILSTLGSIGKDLKFHEKDVWQVLSMSEPYLSTNQHPALQTYSVNLYKELTNYNEDIVWVKCLSIWNGKIASIPSDSTFNAKHLETLELNKSNEYYKNVEIIITFIHDKYNQGCWIDNR